MILTTDDFENGIFKIPVDTDQESDLLKAIEFAENKYLPQLFGVELYDLFIVDLASPVLGEPTAARFVKVYNPFNDQTNGTLVRSEGIENMLKGLTYYHYVRDQPTRVTTVGLKRTSSDNSENVSAIGHDVTLRYNKAIEVMRVIQYYMESVNAVDYPEYDGICLKFNHPF